MKTVISLKCPSKKTNHSWSIFLKLFFPWQIVNLSQRRNKMRWSPWLQAVSEQNKCSLLSLLRENLGQQPPGFSTQSGGGTLTLAGGSRQIFQAPKLGAHKVYKYFTLFSFLLLFSFKTADFTPRVNVSQSTGTRRKSLLKKRKKESKLRGKGKNAHPGKKMFKKGGFDKMAEHRLSFNPIGHKFGSRHRQIVLLERREMTNFFF